jgi:hypothetical protein
MKITLEAAIRSDSKLTREQAIELVGEQVVDLLSQQNCEPTGRAYPGDEDETEWSSALYVKDEEGTTRLLTAFYYTTNEEDAQMITYDGSFDGSLITWEISHYTIG